MLLKGKKNVDAIIHDVCELTYSLVKNKYTFLDEDEQFEISQYVIENLILSSPKIKILKEDTKKLDREYHLGHVTKYARPEEVGSLIGDILKYQDLKLNKRRMKKKGLNKKFFKNKYNKNNSELLKNLIRYSSVHADYAYDDPKTRERNMRNLERLEKLAKKRYYKNPRNWLSVLFDLNNHYTLPNKHSKSDIVDPSDIPNNLTSIPSSLLRIISRRIKNILNKSNSIDRNINDLKIKLHTPEGDELTPLEYFKRKPYEIELN